MATNELQIMLTAKGNMENELRTARDRVKDLDQQIKKANASGERISDQIADEYRQATREAKRLSDQVSRTNSEIRKTSNAATGNIAKLSGAIVKHQTAIRNAGLIAAGAFGLLLKSSVTAASNLQESMSKIDAVFGSSAADIKAWSETSATAMVMSQQQALEAAGSYGNLFQAFGLGRTESAEMSKTLVQLAADLASFNNTSVEDALQALQSGLSGETEPMKRYGAALTDVRLKEQALAMGIYDGVGMLSVAEKAQASYALILKDTALAQGDVARTADGLANTQKTAIAEFENAKAAIGTDLLPAVTAITKAFAAFAGFISGLPSPIRNVVLGVGALSIAAMIATPRIISMIAAMKTAGITATIMKTKMKGVGSFLMGPWGVALGVGMLALGHFAEQAAKAQANVDTFKNSINAATGELNQSAIATITEDLLSNISSEDWEMFGKTFGVSITDVTSAIAQGGKAWEDYEGKLNRIVMGKKSGSAQVQILADNARNLASEVAQGKQAWEIAGKAAEIAGVQVDEAGNFIDGAASSAGDAAIQISGLARAFGKLESVVSRQKALADFKKAVKDSIAKPSKEAAYGVIEDFDTAFKSFKDGSKAQAQFVIDNYDSVENAVKTSGLSKKLKNQLLTPLEDAKAEADLVLATLKQIDSQPVSVTYTSSGLPSYAQPGWSPTVRRAKGGPVWGAGTPTSDSIPAMLSNGEYVLRAAAVRSIGMMNLDALNRSGKMIDPNVLARIATRSSESELASIATGPMIGEIHVHNPSHEIDVERAVTRGLAKARRIQQERGTRG